MKVILRTAISLYNTNNMFQFVASASGGHYWDWGDRDKIPVQKALVWSNFCDPVDVRKLEVCA